MIKRSFKGLLTKNLQNYSPKSKFQQELEKTKENKSKPAKNEYNAPKMEIDKIIKCI